MNEPLIECVANFSEGRDPVVIDALVRAVESVAGVLLLDRTQDPDHHRAVLTFGGAPSPVAEAAFRAVREAAARIDLNRHQGAHPRIGAADVVPFVPVEGVTLGECAELAAQTGERIWGELGIPVYLYEAAARRPGRRRLEVIRRGGFEALRLEVGRDPDRRPDFGEAALHPTAGATVVGARKFLIAFNVHLHPPDLEAARAIARAVRASSGGLPHVKAIGLLLASRGLAQVSMNLTDFEVTPVARVFEAIRSLASARGLRLASSEIIGLVPRRALEGSEAWLPTVENFRDDLVLETRLERLRGAAR